MSIRVPTTASIASAEVEVFKDVEFNPTFDHFTSGYRAVNLEWKSVSLTIGKKEILKNITGHVSSGSVCALMGPSGAGKSSLLVCPAFEPCLTLLPSLPVHLCRTLWQDESCLRARRSWLVKYR